MERVIITGGSKGLGLEISKHFLSQGAEVICLSRDKPPLGVIHLPVDFTNQASIQTAIQKIKDIYMDFTTFVCCAGIGYIEKLDEINYEHTQAMFDVNIIGQGYLLSGISQQIKNAGADVIFVGVTIGYKGNEFMPMYSASKRGFRGLVENWRLALKSSPCRVICASPGGMNTDSNI
jgi:NAD(P)-dependent dehydrogenase (short-subunit alcohol dehydrogenase family)